MSEIRLGLPFQAQSKKKKCLAHKVFQPVTHVSTNPARRSLTSVIGRELVYSTRYDANRKAVDRDHLYRNFTSIKKAIESLKLDEIGQFLA